MTLWLKQRLGIIVGASLLGGALVWNSGALRAQDFPYNTAKNAASGNNETPHPKSTRDAAAKAFGAALDAFTQRGLSGQSDNSAKSDGISEKSRRALGGRTDELWEAMASQWKLPAQNVRVQSEGDKTATVVLEAEALPVQPLVLIEENGEWGVDLVETYAKWNNLQGAAKFEAVYKITGIIVDDSPPSEAINRSSCQANLKQIMLGIKQYAQDWDEKLPPAKTWSDETFPYLKTNQLFKCPSVTYAKGYGYAFNSKLSNKPLGIFPDTSKLVSIYETSILKRNAYGNGENIAFRHQNGANYAFADGHVKWFPKTQTPSFKLKP